MHIFVNMFIGLHNENNSHKQSNVLIVWFPSTQQPVAVEQKIEAPKKQAASYSAPPPQPVKVTKNVSVEESHSETTTDTVSSK